MKKPKKRDALKAACLQAAAAVWATGKLHPHYGANTSQQHADGLADFALWYTRLGPRKSPDHGRPNCRISKRVSDDIDKRTESADKAP